MIPLRRLANLRAWMLAAVALLAGCAGMTRLAYDNADTLVQSVAQEYFDFDAAQSRDLKARLQRFHEWHRINELPLYAAFLSGADRRFARGITTDDVTWAFDTMRARYRFLAARAIEEGAPLLATLSPAQVSVLERKLGDNNEKYARNFILPDEPRRVRAQARRMLQSMRQWTGDVTHEQQALIEDFARAHDRQTRLRFEDRVRWQNEALALLRQRLPAKELAPRLAKLFTDPEARRSQEFRREDRRWQEDFGRLLVELNGTLSRIQRAHVAQRLESYASDFTALAARTGKEART